LRGSLRSSALRTVALASGITLLGGASAHAAVDQKVTASQAVAQSCHARNLNGAAGTQSVTTTAPDTGLIRARLSGGGDWDLGVFDANSGRFVAGSASFGSNELAEGFVKGGQKLVVQACRFRGDATSADLSVGFVKIAEKTTGKVQLVRVDTTRKDKDALQSLGLDLTEKASKNSVDVVLHDQADVKTLDKQLEKALKEEFSEANIVRADPRLRNTVGIVLKHLAAREPHLNLPLDIRATAFQRQVWEKLRAIPYGETVSYGDVAKALGNPGAVRAVGHACATNPVALVIPCHRVVREDKSLGGYRWGLERKRRLLETEKARAAKE